MIGNETVNGLQQQRWGNTLRWHRSAGEDELKRVKTFFKPLKTENPKAQGEPRAKGEEGSHKIPRFSEEKL